MSINDETDDDIVNIDANIDDADWPKRKDDTAETRPKEIVTGISSQKAGWVERSEPHPAVSRFLHVQRFDAELGRHLDQRDRALSKHEVAAALCRAAICAGVWAIPEYEVALPDGSKRKIDVVWAKRSSSNLHPLSLWCPTAAFEIEGHNVNASVKKDAESLEAAANEGAKVCAIVLFQVHPNGGPWHPPKQAGNCVARVEKKLNESPGPRHPVEVVLDENLCEKLEAWLKKIRDT